MSLETLGWTPAWAEAFAQLDARDMEPARVIIERRESYQVAGADGERRVSLAGRIRHHVPDRCAWPAVGDWVAVRSTVLHKVVPRRTAVVRKAADSTAAAQVVAANVDTVFIVTSLNRDFNPRRLERYCALVWESGAQPVVVLTKADLCDAVVSAVATAEGMAPGVPVLAVSGLTGDGVAALAPYTGPGLTVALIGSSGVGKSTLTNRLLGADIMEVRAIRVDDDRGRHTTTHRQLLTMPGGGALIDTPGMRELALAEAESGLAGAFEDVEALLGACRFSDCSHGGEPGCAVRQAIDAGELDEARFESYRKLQRELEHFARRQDANLARNTKRRWKRMTQAYRKANKRRWR